jgi:hypothetical protein
MDTAVLVKDERDAGWKLLEKLQENGFPMEAAFWMFLPDAEVWRLFIATPLVKTEGSNAGYYRLQGLINTLDVEIAEQFSVSNISLVAPDSDIVKEVTRRYGKIPFDRNVIRRFSLAYGEPYIYFIK